MSGSLNFGPDWLRALSGGSDDKPPSPPYAMQPVKYKLAEHRYGREEMLGLYAPAEMAPSELEAFPDLLRDRHGQPLAFIAPSEEEERCQMGGVNSSLVLKLAGRGVSTRGRGGMRPVRGRGRGDGVPMYGRSMSGEEGPAGRGDLGARRSWVEPGGRSIYDKGRGEGQPGLTFEQRSRLSSDGRPPGNWRSPNGQEDDGNGEWRVSGGQKSWRRSDGAKNWRETPDSDSMRNRSWNRSNHDRNPSDSWKSPSGGGGLPEWCDNNGDDDSPGTFDSSGQFQLTSPQQGKSGDELTSPVKEVDGQLPSNHTDHDEDGKSLGAKIGKSEPGKTVVATEERPVVRSPPGGMTVSPGNDNLFQPTVVDAAAAQLPDIVTEQSNAMAASQKAQSQRSVTARTEDEEIDVNFGHVKSIMDGLDSEEEETATDPSILYAKKANSAAGRGIVDWLYKDPRGEIQGPFSNEEMNEWFKAGYFTAGLLIRRVCDEIFLPLGDVVKLWNRVPFAAGATPPPITAHTLAQQQTQQRQQETYQRVMQEQMVQQKLLQQQQQQKQRSELLQQRQIEQRLIEQHQQQQRLIEQQQRQEQQRMTEQQQRQEQQRLAERQQQRQQEKQMLQMHEKRMQELELQKQQLLMQQMQDNKRQIEQALLRDLKITATSSRSEHASDQQQQPSTVTVSSEHGDAQTPSVWGGAGGDHRIALPTSHMSANRQSPLLDSPTTMRQLTPSPSAMDNVQDDNDGFQSQLNRKQKKMKKAAMSTENTDGQHVPTSASSGNEDAQARAQEALQQKHQQMLQRHQQMQQLEQQRHLQVLQQQQQQQQQSQSRMPSSVPTAADSVSWQRPAPASSALSMIEIQRLEEERQRELKKREQMRAIQQQQQQQDQRTTAGWKPAMAQNSANSILQIQQEEARRQQAHQQNRQQQQPQRAKAVAPLVSSSAWNAMLPQGGSSPGMSDDVYKSEGSFWDDVMKPTPQPGLPTPASTVPSSVSNHTGVSQSSKPNRKTREEEAVQRLFQDQQSDDFVQWVEKSLPSVKNSVEVPTFVAFLKDIDSAQEIEEYVKSYLGKTEPSRQFLNEFLRRRSKRQEEKIAQQQQQPGRTDAEDAGTATGEGSGGVGGDDAVQPKKMKKKKKMQKVNPYLLGFSCNSGADIVNRAGEIMKAEDAWNMKR